MRLALRKFVRSWHIAGIALVAVPAFFVYVIIGHSFVGAAALPSGTNKCEKLLQQSKTEKEPKKSQLYKQWQKCVKDTCKSPGGANPKCPNPPGSDCYKFCQANYVDDKQGGGSSVDCCSTGPQEKVACPDMVNGSCKTGDKPKPPPPTGEKPPPKPPPSGKPPPGGGGKQQPGGGKEGEGEKGSPSLPQIPGGEGGDKGGQQQTASGDPCSDTNVAVRPAQCSSGSSALDGLNKIAQQLPEGLQEPLKKAGMMLIGPVQHLFSGVTAQTNTEGEDAGTYMPDTNVTGFWNTGGYVDTSFYQDVVASLNTLYTTLTDWLSFL